NGRCETPAGIASLRETPQAQVRRGGSRTARGKRVPEVEINVQICTSQKNVDKLDFHRVCLQSKRIPLFRESFLAFYLTVIFLFTSALFFDLSVTV
ncbi:UNVERIFIED_CONTAM: hypothetical protein FO527_22875, partial [Bacillus sp. ATCC 13368]